MILFNTFFLFGEALWTILPGPVPKRKRLKHLEENKLFKKRGLIENQSELKEMKYGDLFKSSVSYSGCGAIAVYNALSLLNKRVAFPRVIYDFETFGSALHGMLGVSPLAIFLYLKKLLKNERRVSFSLFLRESDNPDIAVATVFNDRKNIFKALHTVCIERKEDGFYIHNAYFKRNGKFVLKGPYKTCKEAALNVTKNPALLCITKIY